MTSRQSGIVLAFIIYLISIRQVTKGVEYFFGRTDSRRPRMPSGTISDHERTKEGAISVYSYKIGGRALFSARRWSSTVSTPSGELRDLQRMLSRQTKASREGDFLFMFRRNRMCVALGASWAVPKRNDYATTIENQATSQQDNKPGYSVSGVP